MTSRREIVVVGGGGHARVLISALRKLGTFQILGYTDLKDRGSYAGVHFLGTDDTLGTVRERHASCAAAIGLGTPLVSAKRRQVWEMLLREGFEMPFVVAPDAVVDESVLMGQGTVVFEGAVVNSGTRLGKNCIINTNATVEHDCDIADHAHVASGAILAGGVKVGENSMVGAGATVIQGVVICAECMVGAGAVVLHDIAQPGTYVGNPARRLK